MMEWRRVLVPVTAATILLVACGDDDTATGVADDGDSSAVRRPTVVVTTTALGDVVESLSGGRFEVVTIMPIGVDPHDFRASAQQASVIREADALVVNGGGLEEGLADVVEAAEEDGVATFEALSAVDTIEFGGSGRDHDEGEGDHDEGDGDHDEAEGDHDHDHDADGVDPHFFLDPARMAVAAEGIGDFLAEVVVGVDDSALQQGVAGYVAELQALDAEVDELLAGVDPDRRVLVTNHDAFSYFAERYDFEVIGTVIPGGSTTDGTSAAQLARLAEIVREEDVPAIFGETTTSGDLARTLAAEVGDDVTVVELFTGSLGAAGSGAETYPEMIRTNARRIADALA